MRFQVLSRLRRQLVGSVGVALVAGLMAGCSADTVRFDDGFYTGSVPQSVPTQTAANQAYPANQPYPGNQAYPAGVDQMSTGAISRPGPGASQPTYSPGYPQAVPGAGSSQVVQQHTLPPPPAPDYRSPAPTAQAMPAGGSASQPVSASDAGPTRGAPPTTLQEQAARIAAPTERPADQPRVSQPRPAPTASARTAGSVTVGSGDTLLSISRRTGVSVADLKRANGLDSDTIRLGQTIAVPQGGRVPAKETTRVATAEPAMATPDKRPAQREEKPVSAPVAEPQTAEKGDRPSVAVAAPAPTAPASTIKQETSTNVAAVAPNSTGISGFRWPVQGRVINRFGEKVGGRRNDGLNISVPRGTPVKAAENGVVIYAGDGLKEFGNTVLVKHDDGLVTVYGNAESLEVSRGDKVRRGQQIAKSGMSGDTDVPILHFEVRKNSAPVDPTKYLQ
ncbi:peptidoglycan DD-metalloendopeptidase family protein [Aurantimonas sp. VKM B-3413]|uniref:peptidoglycan DD-metalloendopeptidase family protein n=1 Tax=Aurantimonas sp. VKM B-3413 TaxID=2779401 RepID=UPI001E35B1D5|nr:peptidoglycan DD-metalloendopeptidase family protein [Aurantimonas sp. VKM B-3413]MCB8836681.1 peptidoglycan DD-metalloendopeptidase family protein [Aurantimonas sp. VKM B-3413]